MFTTAVVIVVVVVDFCSCSYTCAFLFNACILFCSIWSGAVDAMCSVSFHARMLIPLFCFTAFVFVFVGVAEEEEEEEMGPCTDRWVWKFVCAVNNADLRA